MAVAPIAPYATSVPDIASRVCRPIADSCTEVRRPIAAAPYATSVPAPSPAVASHGVSVPDTA
eukprot:3346199-Rhodomonas_salina.3